MKRYPILLVVMVSASCIDPINLNVSGRGGTLVVDGWITDQPGPYTVRLTRSIPYDNEKPLKVYPVLEVNAKLSIVDDAGNSEVLTEVSQGVYRTNTMKGQVGRTYQLFIETSDGNKYHSSNDELRPVPAIDQLQYEYQVTETLYLNAAGTARVQKLEAFAIYALLTDPAATDDYYRWQVDGIFEFFSVNNNPEIKQCWAPLTRLESKLLIASDLYTDGRQFRQYLANVPYDRVTYFLVKVRQQSLSKSAYDFLSRVSSQQTSTGTLFDPPPSLIVGNITNENRPEELVLGYFGASSIAQGSMLINRFPASNYMTPSRYKPALNGDCRTQEPYATNIKPEGF